MYIHVHSYMLEIQADIHTKVYRHVPLYNKIYSPIYETFTSILKLTYVLDIDILKNEYQIIYYSCNFVFEAFSY